MLNLRQVDLFDRDLIRSLVVQCFHLRLSRHRECSLWALACVLLNCLTGQSVIRTLECVLREEQESSRRHEQFINLRAIIHNALRGVDVRVGQAGCITAGFSTWSRHLQSHCICGDMDGREPMV